MRDIKVILLSLLSVGLIGTWAYHLYDKTRYTQVRNETTARDSLALADALRDSLQSLYQTALQQMDEKLELTDSSLSFTQVRADSLQRTLDGRMLEIGRLRTEVQQILARGRSTSPEEMALARQKIAELQGQVDQLESQKNSMEAEKADLTRTLNRLTQNAGSLEQNIRQLSEENSVLNQKIQRASIFVANAIRLKAIQAKGSKETPTTSARRTDKWVVSFEVQNKVTDFENAEVAVVLIQPDQKVLQKEAWNSGNMQTAEEGARPYTRQIKFDYARDERKVLTFSLDVDDVEKGNYVLELWHKGQLIGKTATGLK